MAVGTGGPYTRAIGVVDGGLQLLENVVLHLVTTDAESLGVCHLHCRIERSPEDDPGHETAQRQEAQAVMHAGAGEGFPTEF